jgi:ABC-type oligopeptide transport system substrate-binding subunit
MSLRRIRWTAGAAALAIAVAGCTGGGGGDQAAGDGNVSVYICEPESLIPQDTNEVCGAEVLSALFTPLVEYNADTSDMEMTGVAQSIDSTDQKVWTITLKDGYTFHNGEAVDAASFARGWNAGAYAPNAYGNSYFFENIVGYDDLQLPKGAAAGATPKAKEMSGLKVVDPQTLQVTLKAPFSQFPVTLGYTAFYPLPKAFEGDPKKFNEAPIGNGAFKMDGTWRHNEAVPVARNDDYAGDKAKAGAVTFKIYSNINTAYNDLLAGDLDIMDELPPERVSEARSQLGDRFIDRDSSQFTYLGFPIYDEKFANPNLRKAFSMAINRQEIIDAIFSGAYTPADSLVAPVFSNGQKDPCGEACTFNPAKAKQLFQQAGGYDGTLTLWLNSGAGHEKWVEAVSNQLRTNLGIQKVEFRQLEFAQYLQLLDSKKITGPFRLGWVADYPSPQNYLQPLYSSTGSSNNFGYSNPRVDELIADANAADSVEKGVDFYNQAEKLVLGDMPIIPMWFEKTQAAHSERVSDVHIDAFTRIHLADVTVNQ